MRLSRPTRGKPRPPPGRSPAEGYGVSVDERGERLDHRRVELRPRAAQELRPRRIGRQGLTECATAASADSRSGPLRNAAATASRLSTDDSDAEEEWFGPSSSTRQRRIGSGPALLEPPAALPARPGLGAPPPRPAWAL